MYKHILVAVDGSEISNSALHESIKLAKEQQAALRLIHVVDGSPVYMVAETPYPIPDFEKAMRESGQTILSTSEKVALAAGIKPETKLAVIVTPTRRICDVIAEEANSWPADLIVIGTHGRRGFSHLLLGSVAEGVIRLATKPILIIRGS
jgi:nucleotide-binding universal stress UspA family protein